MRFDEGYLDVLVKRQTPSEFEYRGESYEALVRNYSDIRNVAKKLLENPGDTQLEASLEELLEEDD